MNVFEKIIQKIEAPEENKTVNEIEKVEKWKNKRVGKITASQLPKFMQRGRKRGEVFGKEAIKVLIQTKGEMRIGESFDQEIESFEMRWGKENEFLALQKVKEKYPNIKGGSEGKEISFRIYKNIFGSSPDFEGEKLTGEIKCPVSRVKIEMERDHINFIKQDEKGKFSYHEYFWQIVGHLIANPKAEKCIYVIYDAYVDEAYFHELKRIDVLGEISDLKKRLDIAEKAIEASKNDGWKNKRILNINENLFIYQNENNKK